MESSIIIMHQSALGVGVGLDKDGVPIALVTEELLVVTHAALIKANISSVLAYTEITPSAAKNNLVLSDVDRRDTVCSADRSKGSSRLLEPLA
jgi:hypothetical protein